MQHKAQIDNRLIRVLHVAPRLLLSVAYEAVFRDERRDRTRVPYEIFGDFCNVWTWCRVEGQQVVAQGELPPSETSSDDLLVVLIREIGRPVTRRELERRASEEGLTIGAITHCLSYSNVLIGSHGFYAVVGDTIPSAVDRKSSAGGAMNGVIDAPPSPPGVRPVGAGGSLVLERDIAHTCDVTLGTPFQSDGSESAIAPSGPSTMIGYGKISDLAARDDNFVEHLVKVVQQRVSDLRLDTPWSVAELSLSGLERESIFRWGQVAEWNFRSDDQVFRGITGEVIRLRTALGLTFTLLAAEANRKDGRSGAVWPAVLRALGPRQQQLFMAQENVPKLCVRLAAQDAWRFFGIRHDAGEDGSQTWVRTLGAQYALSFSQLPLLPELLTKSPEFAPIAIELLLNQSDKMYSKSFCDAWDIMRNVRRGTVGMETAELRLKNNPWTNHFSVAEILSHCMESVAQGAQPGARDLPDQNAFAYSYFQPPRLKWAAENPILEFSLNPSPPAWVDVDRLMFLCEEPLMKQPVFVSEQGWQFAYSPLSLSLVAHRAPYFRFDLQVKGVSRLPAPLSIPLLPPAGFAFFDRNGNIIENDASGMPVAERLHLLAPQAVKIAGAGDQLQLPFRSVLGGAYRLTQIPAGVAEHISLLNEAGESLWISEANNCSLEEPTYLLDIIGGRWGAPVAFRLPVTTFVPKKLR